MIALPYLNQLNEKASAGALNRRDNFNRDSSCVHSRDCFIIHSGVHRSTACISKEEHPDSYFAAQYWLSAGQAELNAFVETIIDGASLETAEENSFRRSRPEWTVRQDKGAGKLKGGEMLTAYRKSGTLRQSVGAFTWRHLHDRTK